MPFPTGLEGTDGSVTWESDEPTIPQASGHRFREQRCGLRPLEDGGSSSTDLRPQIRRDFGEADNQPRAARSSRIARRSTGG